MLHASQPIRSSLPLGRAHDAINMRTIHSDQSGLSKTMDRSTLGSPVIMTINVRENPTTRPTLTPRLLITKTLKQSAESPHVSPQHAQINISEPVARDNSRKYANPLTRTGIQTRSFTRMDFGDSRPFLPPL